MLNRDSLNNLKQKLMIRVKWKRILIKLILLQTFLKHQLSRRKITHFARILLLDHIDLQIKKPILFLIQLQIFMIFLKCEKALFDRSCLGEIKDGSDFFMELLHNLAHFQEILFSELSFEFIIIGYFINALSVIEFTQACVDHLIQFVLMGFLAESCQLICTNIYSLFIESNRLYSSTQFCIRLKKRPFQISLSKLISSSDSRNSSPYDTHIQNIRFHQINNMITRPAFILVLLSAIFSNAQCAYNKTWSKTLNAYSALTHCTSDSLKAWDCKLCKIMEMPEEFIYIEQPQLSVAAFAGFLPSVNKIIFVWRGTVDIQNWIEDFIFKKITYNACRGCEIHQGFYLDYMVVQSKALSALNKLVSKYPDAQVTVTGSSLGGALAVVNALDFQLKTNKVEQLHVFGCPRVGNINLAQFITLKFNTVFRVVHYQDIVPHLPLLQEHYFHPPYQVYFDESMDAYVICDGSGEDPNCSDAFYPNFSISDHVSYWYKPVIENLCTEDR